MLILTGLQHNLLYMVCYIGFGGVLTITGSYPVTAAEAGLEGVSSARSGFLSRYGH